MANTLAVLVLFAVAGISATIAYDPDALQDICVADLNSGVKVNGFPCKSKVKAADFSFAGLAKPGNITGKFGSLVTTANVMQIPGLNTLGVSLARIDYKPGGLNPPHTHPRGTEMIFVLDGELDVGFITTADVLITKNIKKGEIFVFPRGLIHFQKNNGEKPASVIAAFNSQLPGAQVVAVSLFASTPPVTDDALSIAFQIDTKEVEKIKAGLNG
ncbi:Cupin 1 [Dillenia turbinata]|uniref:Germin-like protein n=1 Tax=Dillenia turbinata TaxID=194707 RepID=A0AAN8YYJ1_9MAGN